MREFGLIGCPLGHSFSAKYFTEKFAREGIDARYGLYEVRSREDEAVIAQVRGLDGFNVTCPYKERILPYLDALDETARAIGAVNVVRRDGDRWTGYNTDCVGFEKDLAEWFCGGLSVPEKALVLGTGGAAKAVVYGLRKHGIAVRVVSREPSEKCGIFGSAVAVMGYEALTEEVMAEHRLIVNCTPLGMVPNEDSCPPMSYALVGDGHWLYDCVYNPAETVFLRKGRLQGAQVRNGLGMLMKQAEAAWEVWNKE